MWARISLKPDWEANNHFYFTFDYNLLDLVSTFFLKALKK